MNGATTTYRHYIYAGSEPVAIYARSNSGTNTVNYVLEDHQGSIASIITNSTPGPVADYVSESFTAYGNRRSGETWSGAPSSADETSINGVSRQGYTWQTALGVSMGLNHMNGRVQDAITGRFLSPDPYIPDPGNTQSFNRYSYVNNNPLSLIDPSGFDPIPDPITINASLGGPENPVADAASAIVTIFDLAEVFGWFGGGGPTLSPMQQAGEAHGINLSSPLQGAPSFQAVGSSTTSLATETANSTEAQVVVQASRTAAEFGPGTLIGGAIAGGSVALGISPALTNVTDITQAPADGTPNQLGQVTVSAQAYPFDFSALALPTVGIPGILACKNPNTALGKLSNGLDSYSTWASRAALVSSGAALATSETGVGAVVFGGIAGLAEGSSQISSGISGVMKLASGNYTGAQSTFSSMLVGNLVPPGLMATYKPAGQEFGKLVADSEGEIASNVVEAVTCPD